MEEGRPGSSSNNASGGDSGSSSPAELTFVIASAVTSPKEEVAVVAVGQQMGYFEEENLTVDTVNADGSVAATAGSSASTSGPSAGAGWPVPGVCTSNSECDASRIATRCSFISRKSSACLTCDVSKCFWEPGTPERGSAREGKKEHALEIPVQ